jgi:hypothetical protein
MLKVHATRRAKPGTVPGTRRPVRATRFDVYFEINVNRILCVVTCHVARAAQYDVYDLIVLIVKINLMCRFSVRATRLDVYVEVDVN